MCTSCARNESINFNLIFASMSASMFSLKLRTNIMRRESFAFYLLTLLDDVHSLPMTLRAAFVALVLSAYFFSISSFV